MFSLMGCDSSDSRLEAKEWLVSNVVLKRSAWLLCRDGGTSVETVKSFFFIIIKLIDIEIWHFGRFE